jgi:hypothetical protein
MEESFVLLQLKSRHVMYVRSDLQDVIFTSGFRVHLQILSKAVVSQVVAHYREVAFFNAAVAVEV